MSSCKKCGGNDWKVNGISRRCRVCWNAWRREHRKKSPDKKDKKKIRIYHRTWYKNNKEKKLEQCKEYRKNNPHKVNELSSRNRAKKLRLTPLWANRKYIKLFYQLAKLEENRTNRKVEVDHIIPLGSKTVCGLHCEDNLQLLYLEDNRRKGVSYHTS